MNTRLINSNIKQFPGPLLWLLFPLAIALNGIMPWSELYSSRRKIYDPRTKGAKIIFSRSPQGTTSNWIMHDIKMFARLLFIKVY